jgi:multisubunit Na+/H+ antiporter MnhF subunit
MPSPLINTPEALDAATATAIQFRREKLMRIAEGKGIRVRVAYGCAALVGLFAVAALFAGDRTAARILGPETCMLIAFVFMITTATRRKALRELQEMKPPS